MKMLTTAIGFGTRATTTSDRPGSSLSSLWLENVTLSGVMSVFESEVEWIAALSVPWEMKHLARRLDLLL